MWETIRGYLTFTRKERFGVLFLLILISVLFVLPYFFKASPGDHDFAAYEKMKTDIQKFESRIPDSSRASGKYERNPKTTDDHEKEKTVSETNEFRSAMFYFDPNKTAADDWKRLGISERLTQTILHYIQKGGHFQKADDLKKLYGLKPSDYERLSPYVRIAPSANGFKSHAGYDTGSAGRALNSEKTDSFYRAGVLKKESRQLFSPKLYSMTDINLADSATWARFPGIGEKLAVRIIHFREKLGGFYQSEQVGETFGLPDSTFQKIRPYLVFHPVSLNRIDLNTTSREILQSHPYIRWQLAKNILDFRLQHGSYRSVDELLQLAGMDSEKFEKLKPYLIVR
jgi:competence protein ComEA